MKSRLERTNEEQEAFEADLTKLVLLVRGVLTSHGRKVRGEHKSKIQNTLAKKADNNAASQAQ